MKIIIFIYRQHITMIQLVCDPVSLYTWIQHHSPWTELLIVSWIINLRYPRR